MIHDDYYMQFRSEREAEIDSLVEDHKNGQCDESCPLCENERREQELWERQKYIDDEQARLLEDEMRGCERDRCPGDPVCTIHKSDDEKAQACADAFRPLVWALNEIFKDKS